MVDDVVVIQPGDERAQKIARAMASQTANAVIQAFGGGPLTSSEVSRQMAIPITTASYHIENLLDAGLLEVMETRWSEKGREVKVYGLTNQVLIIAPPISDLRSVLQKYATLFGIVVLSSLGLWAILPAVLPASRVCRQNRGLPGAGGRRSLRSGHPWPMPPGRRRSMTW